MVNFKLMRVLGIETSCDDTSMGVVENGKLISMVRTSSEEFHGRYGGVVPEIAARKHLELSPFVLKDVLRKGKLKLKDIEGISVTFGPGLVGSLLVGTELAKTLSFFLKIPFVGVNHLEGHIYSIFFEYKMDFPFLTLLISGGHTEIILVQGHLKYKIIGTTLDDACGEIIDKIGRKLGFPYPAGKELDKLALKGNPDRYNFTLPRFKNRKRRFSFSFSGMKTQALNIINSKNFVLEDLVSSLFKGISEELLDRIKLASKETGITNISVVGGVSASKFLRERFRREKELNFYFPSPELSTDNGGMIALVGEEYLKRGFYSSFELDAVSHLKLGENLYLKSDRI